MESQKKKKIQKKKVNGNKPKGKHHEKIKVEGTFDELINRALNTPPVKKKS